MLISTFATLDRTRNRILRGHVSVLWCSPSELNKLEILHAFITHYLYLREGLNGPQCNGNPLDLLPGLWEVQFQLNNSSPQKQTDQQCKQPGGQWLLRVKHELAEDGELQTGHVDSHDPHIKRKGDGEGKEKVYQRSSEVGHSPEEAQTLDGFTIPVLDNLWEEDNEP